MLFCRDKMELSSSDEENCPLEFWNNWSPLNESYSFDESKHEKKFTRKIMFKSSNVRPLVKNFNLGNWIPPLNFLNTNLKNTKEMLSLSDVNYIQKRKIFCKNDKIIREAKEIFGKKNFLSNSTIWKKDVNLDWGRRVLLNDGSRFNDGNLIWAIVNLGIFDNIKLWVNEYGNISGLADGKIFGLGHSEVAYICITDTTLLRRMLNLESVQWESLCQAVQETKTILKFDAFQDYDLMKKSFLEKLWFFLCKRRHFLTQQCMLVKVCGAIKCMRKFQIISKLIVQDIRNLKGEPII